MKPIKVSHTSITKWLECGEKYKLHYIDKVRPIFLKSALIFGGALDHGLNSLLNGKTLQEAKEAFKKAWSSTYHNGQNIALETTELVTYSKSDIDQELLEHFSMADHNNPGWASLLLKGYLMLETYSIEFIPKIKEIIAVQKKISLENNEGDKIEGFLDLEVKLDDNKVYILDNKSSSVRYEADSPKKSQQLVLYYYIEKDDIKIDSVGFAVLSKKIDKQRKKVCSVCEFDGSATRHETCNNLIETNRCGGKYIETINPKAKLELITNTVDIEDEERVLKDIDTATHGIKNGHFEKNLSSCQTKFGKCQYYNLCHGDSMEGLTVLEKKK